MAMDRPSGLSSASSFHPYAHHYAGAAHHMHPGPAQLTYRQPQPQPQLAAGYNTGLHLHTQATAGHHHPCTATSLLTMSGPAYMPSDEELAHLQKLSNDYEPEATGPLVGDRQSSSAITTEYANADPIYRIKTAALPAKYAFFRTCRGDGHCGWRGASPPSPLSCPCLH
jgi:ubiquitin thioesterase protein OTUB1